MPRAEEPFVMRCFRRGLPTAAGLCVALALAGCGSFDPTSWFDNKKPIPGERRAVFPEGVPGVPQGVPPELVTGNQPDPAAVATAEAGTPAGGPATATAAKSAPRTASRPKPRPKSQQARTPAEPAQSPPTRAPTRVTVQPQPAAQP